MELQSSQDITRRIDEMADTVIKQYKQGRPLFVCLLRGGAPFASRLMFAIAKRDPSFHPELDYLTVRTYGDSLESKKPQLITDLDPDTVVKDRTAIILDDVLDEGHTAAFIADHLQKRGAASVDLIVLVQKRRQREVYPVANLFGFEAPTDWLVGMGMDDPRITHEAKRWQDSIAIDSKK